MSPVVSQGPHGRLTQGAGFVHLDILPMLGQHVLLVFLLVGELEGTERAEKAMVLLHVPEVVSEASDCVLTVRAGAVHLDRRISRNVNFAKYLKCSICKNSE